MFWMVLGSIMDNCEILDKILEKFDQMDELQREIDKLCSKARENPVDDLTFTILSYEVKL